MNNACQTVMQLRIFLDKYICCWIFLDTTIINKFLLRVSCLHKYLQHFYYLNMAQNDKVAGSYSKLKKISDYLTLEVHY